jgi:hypothetical protein
MSENSSNKRAFKRIERKFVVRIATNVKSSAPDWSLVITHNFSAGGALFTLDRDVKEGEQLWVKFHFMDRVINCQAKVIRSVPGFREPLVQVGVVFEALRPEDKEFINNFCDQFPNP